MGQFDDLFDESADKIRANAAIRFGVEAQPDTAAREQVLARRYGLPPAVIAQYRPDYEARAKVEDASPTLDQSPKLRAWLSEDMSRAKVAHDDLDNMGAVERTVTGTLGDVGVAALKGAMGLPQAIVGLLDLPTFGYAGKGLDALGLNFNESQKIAESLYSPAQRSANQRVQSTEGFTETLGAALSNPSTIATTLGESLPSMLGGGAVARGLLGIGARTLGAGMAGPALPGILARTFGSSAPLLAGAAGEGIIGAGSAAEQIRATQQDGTLSVGQVAASIASGVGTGALSVLGGKVAQRLGIADLDTALASGQIAQADVKKGLLRELAEAGVSEGVLEELPQSAQEQIWQNIATDRPVFEGVANASAVGMLSGAVGGGGFQIASHLASRKMEQAQRAEGTAATIEQLNRLAQASKVAQRDPATFEGFVAQAAEGGPVQDVFINAQTLAQSGVAEALAQVSPAVAEQLQTALATGGDIKIPVAEYAARIAPTEYAQGLLDHLKTEPQGMSRAEAQEYMQSHAETLQAEVERVLTEKQGDETFKAQAEAVKTEIKTQLDRVGRFTGSVNDAYASMVSNFYSVMAAKLGTSPQDLFARYPVKVAAERIAGEQVLNQITPEQAMATNVPVELPTAPEFTEAVGNTPGAQVTENGLLIDLVRFQKPEQEGAQAIRTGVFYLPAGSKQVTGYKGGNKVYGGTEKFEGQTLIRRPMFVKGATGGKAPEVAYDTLKGKKAYESMRNDVLNAGRNYAEPRSERAKRVAAVLEKYGADPGLAAEIVENSTQGNQLAYAIQENIVAHAVRAAGYDAVVGYGKAKGENRISEVFDVREQTFPSHVLEAQIHDAYLQDKGGARGAFNPATNTITLLKGADLSTFLHESGHFFLETQFDIAAKLAQEAQVFGPETNQPGESQILKDTNALLKWFGVESLNEWYGLDFEQKRSYHEQFARGFEAYLFEGKAPSIELQGLFQRFRAWLLNVYRELKNLNVELTDEVRSVFDRMLATTEEIKLAEQGRSMMPLFTAPEQAGMTTEEFAAYQALGVDATNDAIQDLQARGLRDLAWSRNARGREIKRLQKEAAARRSQVQIEARREVLSQPVYRAWQFLTRKLTTDDKAAVAPAERPKSTPGPVDPSIDSLSVAIAKLGGIDRKQAEGQWGVDPKERSPMPIFGKYLLRREGGRSIDAMGQALSEYGYLTLDENGQYDLHELEEKFYDEMRGAPHYSMAVNAAMFEPEGRAGEGVTEENVGAGRLDLVELKGLGSPAEIVEHIQNLKMTAKDGIHPDIVAEIFGFSSGDELVRTLAAAQDPKTEIEGLTDQRMLEQYGELATPAAIEREADKAIHNENRARVVATEANALAKATGKPKILASAAREFARTMISRLKVRDIRPGQYANAEVRAANAAEKASKAGDIATAAAEKRNQLVNNYATRAAYDAQDEIEKGLRYLKKFDGDIKGLDADYADQIDALLERFDLRKQSLKAIDKRTALAEWIKSQREQGLEPEIPPALENEAFRKSFKDLTVEEFRGLVDTVRQIEHLGRLKDRLLTAADNRAFEAVKTEIVQSIEANAGDRQADTRTPITNLGRALQQVKRFYSAHIKAASWARILDGGKDGGPMWEYFIRSANDRGEMESTMRAEATTRLAEIMAPVFKLGKMGGKGQFFPSIGRSLNREARITIALNTGNQGNLQRLLGGEGWTVAQITPVLQSLTAAEWRAVQSVWNHFESYRPQIAAKERRVYGREPNWVEPAPFTIKTADGEDMLLAGGYYPIKYDPAASQRAEEHADAEGAKRQLQGAYTTATTRRSFTKTRAEEVSGRPLLYTLAGLYSGVNDVIHDLAWHEWLIDANRLLRSKSIDSAIRNHYGPEVKAQFKSWAADIAEGDKAADNAGEIALSRLRQGISAAGLGFNVMSAALQVLGFTQSIVRVGPTWVGKGIARYSGSPLDSTREVQAKSEFMANRARTRFRELNELRNQVQDENPQMAAIKAGTYFLMMRAQQMVDVPTWIGAYEKAISEGNEEERAIGLADQAVIDAQGGGQTKDLAAIERGGPALKIFTVFYSFMNTAFNLGVTQTMTAKSRARLAADYLLIFVVPAVLGALLKDALTPGDAGDDDPEKLAKKLAAEQLSYLMGMMIVAREFSFAAKTVVGAEGGGRDYTGPAGLRLVTDTGALVKQASQGEFDDAFRKSAINVLGDLTGLPSAQVNRTITGAKALAEGETSNPAAVVFGFQRQR